MLRVRRAPAEEARVLAGLDHVFERLVQPHLPSPSILHRRRRRLILHHRRRRSILHQHHLRRGARDLCSRTCVTPPRSQVKAAQRALRAALRGSAPPSRPSLDTSSTGPPAAPVHMGRKPSDETKASAEPALARTGRRCTTVVGAAVAARQ